MLEATNEKTNNAIEVDEDESEVVTKPTVNGFNHQNGYNHHHNSDDEDDEEESYYKFDKNNNNLNKTNKINEDDTRNKNNLTLQSFKFEDFLIKFSK